MKWREKRNREPWPIGPTESDVEYFARAGGVTYRVRAAWRDPMKRSGAVIWWITDGRGNNASFATKEAAMAEAERRATNNEHFGTGGGPSPEAQESV